MRWIAFTSFCATSLFCALAYAGSPPINTILTQPPGSVLLTKPDCHGGFYKYGAGGSPASGHYYWSCATATIVCPDPPAPPPNMEWHVGVTAVKALPSAPGTKIKYSCDYTSWPRLH